MIKGLLFQQQQQEEVQLAMEENLSNLTSASGEASACSGNRADQIPANYSGQYFSAPRPPKKKRNLPGNPDPDADVIALSPKALLATNRFVCEICNKGFQRDQNLQLHRRGHNLPWKLKQRANKEVVRKKVYVCPEASCVHHDPSRALGDLTGIKKHFCRKHGEKKWKCDKCSKRYAVQSDWKAHSKTCGTREYRCDCGTLFSRRDSFITHRAFCDALAEESARAITSSTNPILMANQNPPPVSSPIISHLNFQNHPHFTPPPLDHHIHSSFSLKKEQINHHHHHQIQTSSNNNNFIPPNWFLSQPLDHQIQNNNNNNNNSVVPTSTSLHILPSPHMSATALLQKAAQMGAAAADSTITSSNFGLHLSSSSSSSARDNHMAAGAGFPHALPPYRNNNFEEGSCFEDAFGGILGHNNNNNQKKDGIFNDAISRGSGAGEEGNLSTRDFLGLRAISHSEFLNNIAAYSNCMNVAQSSTSQSPIQKPWQG